MGMQFRCSRNDAEQGEERESNIRTMTWVTGGGKVTN
jgi:hypothetical protein